jgi:hypothetical protein
VSSQAVLQGRSPQEKKGLVFGVTSAVKSFTQPAPYAAGRSLFVGYELRFTVSAESLLTGFHWPVAGLDCHRTKLDAVLTMLAKLRPYPEWIVHVAVLAASDETDRPGLPDFGTDPHTSSTKHAIVITELVSYLFYPTANRNILNRPGVGSLGHQQFGQVAPQPPDFFGIRQNHHPFLHIQGAGSSYPMTAFDDIFHDAQTAGADIREIGNMAEMGNADPILNGSLQHAGPPDGMNYGTINIYIYILLHLISSLLINLDCTKFAFAPANPAFLAELRINHMRLLFTTGNRRMDTTSQASAAAGTFIGID